MVLIIALVAAGRAQAALGAVTQVETSLPLPVSQVTQRTFTPHMTVSAKTREQWKIAFQRAPGSNLNTTFIASSFSVAVLPRVEVGTIPIFWAMENHHSNFNVKLNFWRSPSIDWALGYSRLVLGIDGGDEFPNSFVVNQAYELISNFHPEWTKASLSVSTTLASSIVRGHPLLEAFSMRSAGDFGVDVSYPILRNVDLTVGAGTLRDSGFTAYEESKFGFGFTTALYRPKKFFSKLSVGSRYVPVIRDTQFLFGLEFF